MSTLSSRIHKKRKEKSFPRKRKKNDLSPFSQQHSREAVMPKDTSPVDTQNVSAEEDLQQVVAQESRRRIA
jgi:hypothetical protein